MAIKVLIFGKHGQVGNQLVKQLACFPRYLVVATDIEDVDLTDSKATRDLVLTEKPDWVINTSAHTAVDRAESEEALAHQLNCEAPGVIASACKKIDSAMIHYSTDYVFDGAATAPYEEEDAPNPQSVYGRTKLGGERAVLSQLDRVIILRTAWVYSRGGKNFVNTMLRLAEDREQINVVNDQFGSPTLADDLAAATISIVNQIERMERGLTDGGGGEAPPRFGIFHATGGGVTNWSGFSEKIMQLSGNDHVTINPIPGSQYPTPAPRPNYSVLSNRKLLDTYGIRLPDWQDALSRCLS